jgi:hypothetical protein
MEEGAYQRRHPEAQPVGEPHGHPPGSATPGQPASESTPASCPASLQALQLFGGFPLGRIFVEFEESQRVDGAAGLEFADEAAGRPQVLGKKIVEAANRFPHLRGQYLPGRAGSQYGGNQE